MKILAVIPARSGSKGIPNKNIRIVGGHPLIYYSINNAKKSQMISDIIVTTDSPEIKIIARQLGVGLKERRASLCLDEVTLDEVVYDAMQDKLIWDYIVTLQPTSPTLYPATLDAAIQYAIDRNLDTLISVKNRPHLAWIEKDGRKIPAYKERKNRQYLPSYYEETGAFVISKAEIVTKNTRIGNYVDVFEISENEAVDIDTFDDLRNASSVLSGQSIAIYVNGNNSRGIGHIYRSMELADEFYVKPDIYYDLNQTDRKVFGETTHNLIAVDGIAELFDQCRKKDYSVFINDILSTSIDYMIGLKSVLPNAKVVNFEDDGEGASVADLVFNALYEESNMDQIKSGEKYYIANKLFMFYNPIFIRDKVERVFISFGGADPQCYTDRLLKIIAEDNYCDFKFTIVLGRAKENIDELLRYNKYENIDVVYDVKNMPELMSKCDIGITSRGRTGYELAMLGIPSIAMSQNKREEKHGFVCNENGFTYIGLNPDDEIIKSNLDMYIGLSKKSREHFQQMLLSHNLRNGRKNVMSLINAL